MSIRLQAMGHQDDLLWVLAGYGGAPWTQILPAHQARLVRLGIWWRRHQTSAPTLVEIINPRLVIINERVLVIDEYGDVVMAISSNAPPAPAPAPASGEVNGKS